MLPKNKVQSSTSHTTNDTNRTISPERIAKMERILSTRQPTLSMFLEDVHNPHNASAVMRSCDAVWLYDMYYTHQHPQGKEKYHINQWIAMGTRKRTSFVEVDDSHVFFEQQKKEWKQIIVTSLQEKSVDFRSIDYTKPTLIVMW